MDAEELKQLKKGDEIFIRARFVNILGDGDVLFSHSSLNVYDEVVKTEDYTHPQNIILPPAAPKYDPCRPFKKGDIVRMVERMGRMECTAPVDEFFQTRPLTVIEDERIDTNLVKVESEDGRTKLFHWWYLELVTPVEELEPYSVGESTDYFSVDKDDEELCLYWKDKHPHAKKAAEAERDRLNAEHRKGGHDQEALHCRTLHDGRGERTVCCYRLAPPARDSKSTLFHCEKASRSGMQTTER